MSVFLNYPINFLYILILYIHLPTRWRAQAGINNYYYNYRIVSFAASLLWDAACMVYLIINHTIYCIIYNYTAFVMYNYIYNYYNRFFWSHILFTDIDLIRWNILLLYTQYYS